MNHQDTLELLDQYQSKDPAQIEFKQKFSSFISGNPSCYESSHPPIQGKEKASEVGHITGSAWVLSPDRKSVLLTHHKKLNKWLQLGGHSDGESNVILTSLREAIEESGIEKITPLSSDIFDLDIHIFPKKKEIGAHLHYDIRFCLVAESTDFTISEESHSLKWIPIADINEESYEESIVRMAQKSKKYQ